METVKIFLVILITMLTIGVVKSQHSLPKGYSDFINAVVNIPLKVTDGFGGDTLFFGLDPLASDGIDPALGEYELPPLPPAGAFDGRFIGTDINPNPPALLGGVRYDYRTGNVAYSGVKRHEISFQRESGASIKIYSNFPINIKAVVYDLFGGIVLKDTLSGLDSVIISSPGISKVFFDVIYNSPLGINTINNNIPDKFMLSHNYPNPFNPATKIEFAVPKSAYVRICIYDVIGEEIAVLVNERLAAGTYVTDWNASRFSSGVYFYKMRAGDFVETRKMIVVR